MQKGNQQHSSGHRMPAATSAKNIRALKITAVLTGTYYRTCHRYSILYIYFIIRNLF